MNKTVIDTEILRTVVKNLKKLESAYKSEVKKNKKLSVKNDVGKTHNSIDNACKIVDQEWNALFKLVENSIIFLSDTSASYDTSDKNSAKSLK